MSTIISPDNCPYTDQNCNTHAQCSCCVACGSEEMEFLRELLLYKRVNNLSPATIAYKTGLNVETVKRALQGESIRPLTRAKLTQMMRKSSKIS